MKWCVAWLFVLCPAAFAGTVEDIKSSGVLTCGLDPARPGFSVRTEDYKWTGLDVDLCRAIAAAVLGNGEKVNLTALSADERIVALQSGEVDVLLHGLPWRQGADSEHGLMFVWPTFVGPEIYAPMVRQGDDHWFHVVRHVVMTLIAPPAADDPKIGASLLLEPGWQTRAVSVGGSYREMFARHFGAQAVDAVTGLPIGLGAPLPP